MNAVELQARSETRLPAEADSPSSWWDRIDEWMERASERLNPILVKEARQALKSRQFVSTFALLLICGWAWSFMALAMSRESPDYQRLGLMAFSGYYVILCIPLLIVVPFAAYQSLANERQDGTYELLSITSLGARQIVLGKLAGAVLQMMVYYSALAPCIGFTYLLRGIDIATIFLALSYAFVFSLLLCSLGLLIGALVRHSATQAGLSALFIVVLVIGTWAGLGGAIGMFYAAGAAYELPEFWIGNLAVFSFAVSFIALAVMAAASAISFASANRSTPLRYIMLGQQVLYFFWVSYVFARYPAEESVAIPLFFAAGYWAFLGALMTGETGELSPRARRTLPRTALGRITLTWFNPGSATGYIFAVCNLSAVAVMATLFVSFQSINGRPFERCVVLSWLFVAYTAFYLGLGRLLIMALRRRYFVSLQGALLIQIVLVIFGALFPPAVQLFALGSYNNDYTLFQAPNWAWTVMEIIDQGIVNASLGASVVVVGCAGALVFVVNLVSAAREVAQERAATPERVLADERTVAVKSFEA